MSLKNSNALLIINEESHFHLKESVKQPELLLMGNSTRIALKSTEFNGMVTEIGVIKSLFCCRGLFSFTVNLHHYVEKLEIHKQSFEL